MNKMIIDQIKTKLSDSLEFVCMPIKDIEEANWDIGHIHGVLVTVLNMLDLLDKDVL